MLIDDLYFSLEFKQGTALLESHEPQQHVYSTRGTIVGFDEYEEKTVAGRFHLYYIDVTAAVNAGDSIFDVFDTRAATFDYFGAIFDPETLELSDKLQRLLKNYGCWGNVLILNRLEILPGFRKKNLGLLAMRRLIERFSAGACLVAMTPFPLQCERSTGKHEDDEWRAQLQLDVFNPDLKRGTAKLRAYYAKLGFKAMRGTPFMFRVAEDPLPTLDLKR